MTARIKASVVFLIIVCASFLLHLPSIKGEFVWDDYTLILNNPKIQEINIQNIKSIFSNGYFSNTNYPETDGNNLGYYRPIANLSYSIFYFFFNKNYKYWHIINIIIHSLNGFIIFIFLNKIFSNILFSAFTSFIFVIHPFHHQAIDYCTGLVDILCLLFTLLSMLYAYKWLNSNRYINCSGTSFFIFYSLSIFTKEANILAPLIIIFYCLYKKTIPIKKIILKSTAFIFVIILYLFIRKYFIGLTLPILPKTDNIILYYTSCIKLFFTNIGRILVPTSSTFLQQYYPINSSTDFFTIIGFLFISCSIALTIKSIRLKNNQFSSFKDNLKDNCNEAIFLSSLFIFIGWLPISNLIPIHPEISDIALYYSDHLSYFYSIGIFLIIAFFLNEIYHKNNFFKKMSITFTFFYLIFLSINTQKNSQIWGNPETFYKTVYDKNNLNIGAILQLGIYYNLHSQPEKALKEYNKLIAIIKPNNDERLLDPTLYAKCLTNIAYSYLQMNDIMSSINIYKEAINFSPNNFMNYFGLGSALQKLGNKEEAKDAFLKTLQINPKYYPAKHQLENL